jgi:hypothetical protein
VGGDGDGDDEAEAAEQRVRDQVHGEETAPRVTAV